MFVGAGGNFDFNVPPCWALSPLSNQWCCSGGQTKLCYTACSADLTAPPQPPVHVGPQGSKTTWCRKKLKGGQLSWMALHTKHQGSRKREIKTWLKEWNVFGFFFWTSFLKSYLVLACFKSLSLSECILVILIQLPRNLDESDMCEHASVSLWFYVLLLHLWMLFFPISFSIIIPPERAAVHKRAWRAGQLLRKHCGQLCSFTQNPTKQCDSHMQLLSCGSIYSW